MIFLQKNWFQELFVINETINTYNLWKNKLNNLINKNKILFLQNWFKENTNKIIDSMKQEDIFSEITKNDNSIFNKGTLALFFSNLKHCWIEENHPINLDIVIEKEIYKYKIKRTNKQFTLISEFQIDESNYEIFYNMENEIISNWIMLKIIADYWFTLNDYWNKNLKQYELFSKEFRIPKESFLEITSNIWYNKDIKIVFSDKRLILKFIRFFRNDDNRHLLEILYNDWFFKININTESLRDWFLDQIPETNEYLILSQIYDLDFDSLDDIESLLYYYFNNHEKL